MSLLIIKNRAVPLELELLRSINGRMQVSKKVENQIYSLEKGYTGEVMFDQHFGNLSFNCLIINDLLLETSNTLYQIDSLLISQHKIHIFEVKNFEGDYLLEGDRLHTLSGMEIKNPLIQLSRSVSLFRQLLQHQRMNFTVEGHLVFINPDFYLYHASPDLPIIFPTQLDRFIKQLNNQPSKVVEKHHEFGKKLLALHIPFSPYSLLPEYSYDRMKKGILCPNCRAFMKCQGQHILICEECYFIEKMESAILRCVKEFSLLFPDKKITTSAIFEWCTIIKSKNTIRKILQANFKYIRFGNSSYFEYL